MILVDSLIDYVGHGKWCHMTSDTGLDELHAFARRIGLKRDWFQGKVGHPHYDLTPKMRKAAINAGARPVSSKELLIAVQAWATTEEDSK